VARRATTATDHPGGAGGEAAAADETAGPGAAAAGDAEAAATKGTATSPLTRALVAAVGSRVLVFAVAFAAATLIGVQGTPVGWRFPLRAEVFSGWLGALLNPWAHWDGVWYIKIATSGYADADGSTAFFPLFPTLLRYVGLLLDGNLLVTGIVISLVCYAGCVWLLYRLVRQDFDDALASRAVIYLAIGPLSFFLQAVYTESLFLLLTLACFVFAREGRWRLAGVLGLLATLTRSTGVLLLIPMAYYYYERRGWKLKKTDSHVANLLMVVEGLLVWMTYLALAFGKPLAFSTAQAQWERGIGAPNYTVTKAVVATVWGLRKVLSAEYYSVLWEAPRQGSEYNNLATNGLNLLFLVIAALLLWYGARRLPGAYSWYALAALAYPLFFPSKYVPLMSYPRFTLTVFPLYVALAVYTRDRPRAHKVVVAVGILLLIGFTAKFAVFSWVA
jgi:Mannosyltransferase (PIG-V)